MEVIFILGASQSFFLTFLVLKKTGKTHGDYVLATWLTFIGLHLIDYYIYSTNLGFTYPHLLGIGVCFPMLQGPFMFIYLLVMISKNGKFKPVYLLHGLPFLLLAIYFTFDFYLLGAEEKLVYYKFLEANGSVPLTLSAIFNSYIGPIYVIWSLIKLRKHIRNISNNFSYTENIDLAWLKYVLMGLGFVWSVVLFSSVLDVFSPESNLGNDLIYLSLTIAIFSLGYFGLKQRTIYTQTALVNEPQKSISSEGQDNDRYKNSGLKKGRRAIGFYNQRNWRAYLFK